MCSIQSVMFWEGLFAPHEPSAVNTQCFFATDISFTFYRGWGTVKSPILGCGDCEVCGNILHHCTKQLCVSIDELLAIIMSSGVMCLCIYTHVDAEPNLAGQIISRILFLTCFYSHLHLWCCVWNSLDYPQLPSWTRYRDGHCPAVPSARRKTITDFMVYAFLESILEHYTRLSGAII